VTVVERLEDLYEREYWPLLRVACSLTGDRARAEDLVHDVFVQAQRHWDGVAATDRPEAWLRRVLVNTATSTWRRSAAEARANGRWAGRSGGARGSAPAVDALPDTELWAAVRRLPRRQREAVVLVHVDDRSVADVAAVLGCAEDTVRTHLRRAHARLARVLGEAVGDGPDHDPTEVR
jgi:RNA polymerase sigma-70 factor (sigma-E family)